MCFSATASFGASALLLAGGVVSVKQAHNPRQVLFASIPLFFSAQQLIEGLVWSSFSRPELHAYNQTATLGYLAFAQVLWPAWVPLSILAAENKRSNRNFLLVLLIMGLTVAIYLLYCLQNYETHSSISGNHIRYELDYPIAQRRYTGLLYFLPTALPPFFSSRKNMWLIGLGIAGSFVISKIFFPEHIISIWCYFAALISAAVIFVVRQFD